MAGSGLDNPSVSPRDAAGTGSHSFDNREVMRVASLTEQHAIAGALDVIFAPREEKPTLSTVRLLAKRRGAEAVAQLYRDLLAMAEAGYLPLSPNLRSHLERALE